MMDLVLAASGGEAQAAGGGYVDDVFSAYTYTGNGGTQTINNGIDLAGKGGLVWIKWRSDGGGGYSTRPHVLVDTARGVKIELDTSSTFAQGSDNNVTAFNSNGFSLGNSSVANYNPDPYVSWTFRKAPKFFDVVTYTGNGASNSTLSHQLNADVGMVMVKATNATGDWWVFHRSATGDLVLNTTAAQTASKANIPSATPSTFTVNGSANTSGVQYVAYLFAHDPSAEGVIQCGSYVGNGSATGPTVTLGWEPQFVMAKIASGATGQWSVVDSARGFATNQSVQDDQTLFANLSIAESTYGWIKPNATGFSLGDIDTGANWNQNAATYIYLAIRRSNKPPTTGTQVYNAIATSATTGTKHNVGFAVDTQIVYYRSGAEVGNSSFFDRLRGVSTTSTGSSGPCLVSSNNSAEGSISSQTGTLLWDNVGFSSPSNWSGVSTVFYNFKRAKGFFDVVCDSGTGVAHGITHGLSVAPEFIIRKSRSGATQWECWHSALAATEKLVLNSTAAKATDTAAWNSTFPTSTQFTVGTGANVNTSAATFVTYLFATLAGVSKVSTYTGNGSTQTIDCGFSAGARFFLVKATSATGSWWIFDSVRGIISAADPVLQLNSTSAEITSADAVDPTPVGIIVNQEATCSINMNGVSYVYLAIA